MNLLQIFTCRFIRVHRNRILYNYAHTHTHKQSHIYFHTCIYTVLDFHGNGYKKDACKVYIHCCILYCNTVDSVDSAEKN